MKICFAFPDKEIHHLYYLFNTPITSRLSALGSYEESLRKEKYMNKPCGLMLFSLQDFENFLKKNDCDYGIISWNGIIQEIYITSKGVIDGLFPETT